VINTRSSKRQANRDADDTLLAGWMYADLFLGLMVVFLATVTFIPEYLGGLNESARNSSYNYQQVYKTPMIVVYDKFNSEQINQDVKAFIRDQGLAPDSAIIYAQIVGAYDQATETQSDGIRRAQAISMKLDAGNIDILRNASTTLSVSSGIPIDRFVLKFTFATSVGVGENP
jgi:hypothetical protein